MTKTAKILAFVATGSLALIALVAVLFALFVGTCSHYAGKAAMEADAQMEAEHRKMVESMEASEREMQRSMERIQKSFPKQPPVPKF
jgi:nitrate reductase cytochrome c-type subunit